MFVRAACLGLLATTVGAGALAQEGGDVDRIIVTVIRPERPEPSPGGQILLPDAAAPGGLPSLGDLLARQGTSVTVSEPQGNPFQPELSYRGYSVSGLLGLPQGLALYQNGVRVNEAFGDVVNFDVVPEVAIESVAVTSGANPLFGLNALGGAVSATMKSGFSFEETALEVSGGSFGRVMGSAESGWNNSAWAAYGAVTALEEDGWRNHSPSEVVQAYGDLARRFDGGEVGLSLTLADSDLNGNGAAPFDLLEADREAVFTYPDNTQNELAFLQARGNFDLSPSLRLESVVFARFSDHATLNGDETDIDECEDEDFEDLLCEEDGDGEPVEDLDGNLIEEDDVGEDPFAVFNRSSTESDSYGAALQAALEGAGGSLFKELIVGGDFDIADTDFASSTELGSLTEDRTVDPSGVFLGDDEFRTGLKTETQNLSAFAAAAFGLTDTLQLTLSGRYVTSDVELRDQLGDDLNGDHEFDRFNPAVELVWRPEISSGGLMVFGRYGESSRTPTSAELSCADPDEPCRFPNAFIADPPLEQVVAKTFEAGFSTRLETAAGPLGLSATAFSARNEDDIIFVSSGPVVGSGYFRNAGETKREGVEAAASWTIDRLTLTGSWTYVSATFEDSLTLLAEDNPAANDDGEIQVQPGDRIPLIPEHSGRFSATYAVTDRIDLEGGVLASSDRVFRGDEGNDEETLDGFARLDLGVGANVTDRLRAFLRIENVLDEEFETFGTFGDVEELFLQEAPGADDPRFLTPAAPRAIFVGVRLTL
jgi:outer membrane receptor protein involved in Fe transport